MRIWASCIKDQSTEKPPRKGSLELLKKLPSPADEPAALATHSQFARMRSQQIARCLANIDHGIYPVKRDAETIIEGKSAWELALAALDEQLPRMMNQSSYNDICAENPESLATAGELEWNTTVLKRY